MTEIIDVSDLKLASVVQEWLTENDFPHELVVSDERDEVSARATLEIDGQLYSLFFDTSEKAEIFTMYFYFPINAPAVKVLDIVRFMNRINYKVPRGRFACADGEAAARIQYAWQIDVEGSELTTTQIGSMYHEGARFCELYFGTISELALTKTTFDEAWSSLMEKMKNS